MLTEHESALSDQETNQEANDSENGPRKENDGPVGDDRLKLLRERLELYQKAEKKAKRGNEAGKARRFGRGIKTLQQLLKDAEMGTVINEADIPPPLPPSAISEFTERPTGIISFFIFRYVSFLGRIYKLVRLLVRYRRCRVPQSTGGRSYVAESRRGRRFRTESCGTSCSGRSGSIRFVKQTTAGI